MKFVISYDSELEAKRLVVSAPHEMFGEWVQSDIQASQPAVDSVIDKIDRVKTGVIKKIELDGNAWIATITPTGVALHNMYTDQKCGLVSLDEVLELLAAWERAILSQDTST